MRGNRLQVVVVAALLAASCSSTPGAVSSGAETPVVPATAAASVTDPPVARTSSAAPVTDPPVVPTLSSSSASAVDLTSADLASDAAPTTGETTPAAIGCPGQRCITLVATGDVLLHPPLWQQAEADAAAAGESGRDFRPLLEAQVPYLSAADLALCHLETPVAEPGAPFKEYPTFSVPPEIVPALAATGYDACSTASNHTEDQGPAGVDATLAALDAAGLKHAGSYRTQQDSEQPTLLVTRNGTVGFIAATYGLNTGSADDPWQVEIIDVPTILSQAAADRAAGADVVVVALHSGTEYDHDPTDEQTDVAEQLLASADVDFVYGHHAHVVQPLEQINNKWVAYGLGNTVAAHGISDLGNREGLLVRITFSQAADGSWGTSDIGWVPSLVDDATPYRWCVLKSDSHCSDDDPTSLSRIESFVNARGAAGAGAHRWTLN